MVCARRPDYEAFLRMMEMKVLTDSAQLDCAATKTRIWIKPDMFDTAT